MYCGEGFLQPLCMELNVGIIVHVHLIPTFAQFKSIFFSVSEALNSYLNKKK